ncbi:LAFE_0F14290g1_1 [Lachancea fermentati]|uniref:LAFE_0F14290g1_1 n=1 Tax=Lachancea fermentati TaxID=4955 RepID=A0A1G4MG41_LACFM|nr:LAFE_0F14290g1_1 [Lachancea fermentati]
MASSSHEFTVGDEKECLPHYHVELTEDYLLEFEMLNSLCSVESYDQLFFFFESNMNRRRLPVPPSDVIIVILTLAAMGEHYKDRALRAKDPYNVARVGIPVRAVKLLRGLLRILEEFEVELYDRYALELLRCQFLIVSDHLSPAAVNPKTFRNERDPQKRRKTNSGVLLESTKSMKDADQSWFSNNYSSYVSVLDHKSKILNCTPLTAKLSQEGEFWNCVAWALYTSMSENPHEYYCGRAWLPILEVIFDLYDLRHAYFMNFELDKDQNTRGLSRSLEKCPILGVFKVLSSQNLQTALCDYLFIGCKYSLMGKILVHSPYHNEIDTSTTYISHNDVSNEYKLKKTMALRRQILRLFFKLLQSLSPGVNIIPHVDEDCFFKDLAETLQSFESSEQLKSFFFTSTINLDISFLPMLAQHTLKQITGQLGFEVDMFIADNLGGDDVVLKELLEEFTIGLPRFNPDYEEPREKVYKSIEICDLCVVVLLRYLIYVHGTAALKKVDVFEGFLKAVKDNDKYRDLYAEEMNWEDLAPPKLYSLICELFS